VKDWKAEAQEAWSAPSWGTAAAEYHESRGGLRAIAEIEPGRLARLRKILNDSTSIEAAWHQLNRRDGAASPVVGALMLGLRSRGLKALSEPAVKRRLSELSEAQVREVGGRLQRLKPEIARAWRREEIANLVSIWTGLKNG
jgi:hypothetical protein